MLGDGNLPVTGGVALTGLAYAAISLFVTGPLIGERMISIAHPRLIKLVFKGDRLVGMVLVNAIEQGGVLTALIQSATPVRLPRETLLEPSFNFRQLLPV